MKTLTLTDSNFQDSLRLHPEAASDVGRVRKGNEDRFGMDEERGLFVVADGMGGHVAGEVAAQIAVEALGAALEAELEGSQSKEVALQMALERVSDVVFARSKEDLDWSGMGATVVALWIMGNQALVAHIGDSRAYLWRRKVLQPLTTDHSLVELLVESGDISREEASTHPMRHQITRFCGMEQTPVADISVHNLESNDAFLLVSDGVTGELSEAEIARLLQTGVGAKGLVAAAIEAGGRDNATAVLVRVLAL